MYELVYCFWFIVVARAATEGLTMSTRLREVKRMRTETVSCLTSQHEVGRKSNKHTNLSLLEDQYSEAVLPFINCSILFYLLTIDGLHKLVNDIPVGKADGLDGIPTCLLKLSFPSIASSLTHIFNLVISKGIIPKD